VERRSNRRPQRVLYARSDLVQLEGPLWLARCEVADPLTEGRRRDLGRPRPPLCMSARRYQARRAPRDLEPAPASQDVELPAWGAMLALTLAAAAWGWLIGALMFA